MRKVPLFTCAHCRVQDADVISITVSYKKGESVHGKWHPACFEEVRPTLKRKGDPMIAISSNVPPSDPRSLDHLSHREQWLALARAIGQHIARDERNGVSGPHIGDVDLDEDKSS